MKHSFFVCKAVAALLCVASLGLFGGCAEEPAAPQQALSYENVTVSAHLRLGAYTGLTIACGEGESRGEAAWRAVLSGCEILSYPEEAVAYYVAQSEARCRYYAESHDVSYEEAMAALSLTEEGIRAEAEAMVAADLAYRAVRDDADIALTDEDKTAHFDRYVDKYVSDWGYDRDYVVKNLSELVYDSMLYDKTTEYLIVHNTFAEET